MGGGPLGLGFLGGAEDAPLGHREVQRCTVSALLAMQDMEAVIGVLRRVTIMGPMVGQESMATIADVLDRANGHLAVVARCSYALRGHVVTAQEIVVALAGDLRSGVVALPMSREAAGLVAKAVEEVARAQRLLREAFGGP